MDRERERASEKFCPRSGVMLTSMTKKKFEDAKFF